MWTGVIPCDILVPHIDSRVKIIDNERPGAGPCDLLLVIIILYLHNNTPMLVNQIQIQTNKT